MTTNEDFYRAEAAYWRARAEELLDGISKAEEALSGCNTWVVPPEPPVGTEFHGTYNDGPAVWVRRADGWWGEHANARRFTWSSVAHSSAVFDWRRVLPGEHLA